MTEVVRPYRGVSAEDRRTERRARLLTACLDVVGADGVAATTVGAVCARAGLTKRYFYESFADLDAILTEAFGAMFSALSEQISTALAATGGTGPLERSRITVRLLIETMDDARIARLYIESPGHPALRALRDQAIEAYTRLVAAEVMEADPADEVALLAARVIVSGTTHAVTNWLQGTVPLGREELIEQLARVGVAVADPAPTG